MGEESSILARNLETIVSDEPQEIREQLVETLREAVPSNLAIFVKCATNDEGERFFTGEAMRGDADGVKWVKRFMDRPAPDSPWFPEHGDSTVVNNFVRTTEYYGPDFLKSFAIVREMFAPIEAVTQLRTVVCDGSRLLGWLGLVRRGESARFRRSEEEELQRALGSVKAVLGTAESLDAESFDGELFAVAGPDGSLAHTSEAFRRWLDTDRRDYLRRRVEAIDRREPRAGTELVAGAEVRIVRLDGSGGVRYVITVDRAELLRVRPEAWLTPRQREVASVAVAGASNGEIASILGVSDETVKSHLTEIYRRLRVDNRTELASLLAHLAG